MQRSLSAGVSRRPARHALGAGALTAGLHPEKTVDACIEAVIYLPKCRKTRTVGVHNPQLEGGECRNVKHNCS